MFKYQSMKNMFKFQPFRTISTSSKYSDFQCVIFLVLFSQQQFITSIAITFKKLISQFEIHTQFIDHTKLSIFKN